MAETSEPLFDIGANLLDSQLFKNIDSIVLKSIENNIRKIVPDERGERDHGRPIAGRDPAAVYEVQPAAGPAHARGGGGRLGWARRRDAG